MLIALPSEWSLKGWNQNEKGVTAVQVLLIMLLTVKLLLLLFGCSFSCKILHHSMVT